MYRDTGTVRIVLHGNTFEAKKYIGKARAVVGYLNEYASYNELDVSQHVANLPSGVRIRVLNSGGIKTIHIYAGEEEQEEIDEDVYCFQAETNWKLFSTEGYSRASDDSIYRDRGLISQQPGVQLWAERGGGIYTHIGNMDGLITYYDHSDTIVASTRDGGRTTTLLGTFSSGFVDILYTGIVTTVTDQYKRLHGFYEDALGRLIQYRIRYDTGVQLDSSVAYDPGADYEFKYRGGIFYLGNDTLYMPFCLRQISTGNEYFRFLYTTNGGDSWSEVTHSFISGDYSGAEIGDTTIYEYGYMTVADNGTIVYIVPAPGFTSIRSYTSVDNGASWSYKTDIGTAYISIPSQFGSQAIAIDRYQLNVLVQRDTAYNFDIYTTDDYGLTWSKINTIAVSDKKYMGELSLYKEETGANNNAVILNPRWTGTEYQMYYSDNSGYTFTPGKTISTKTYPSLTNWAGLPEFRSGVYVGTTEEPAAYNIVFPLLDTNGPF